VEKDVRFRGGAKCGEHIWIDAHLRRRQVRHHGVAQGKSE